MGSLKEMGELMELVRSGKIDPVQVESRHISQATDTLRDLKNGDIPGMVCLKH